MLTRRNTFGLLLILCMAAIQVDAAIVPLQANLTPVSTSTASGTATMQYDDVAKAFDLDVVISGIALASLQNVGPNLTSIHIHAPTGGIWQDLGFFGTWVQDGGNIRLTLNDVLLGGAQGNLTGPAASIIEPELLAGNTYINVHTQTFPGGEIRGNLAVVPEPAAIAILGLVTTILGVRPRGIARQ